MSKKSKIEEVEFGEDSKATETKRPVDSVKYDQGKLYIKQSCVAYIDTRIPTMSVVKTTDGDQLKVRLEELVLI